MKNRSTSNSARAINSRGNALKSLLTLASGAASLGALAPEAEAGIWKTPFSATVGLGAGTLPTYSIDLPGTAGITLKAEMHGSVPSNSTFNRIAAVIANGQFGSQAGSKAWTNVALRVGPGGTWYDTARKGAALFGNIIKSISSKGKLYGPGAFSTPSYLLFKFTNTDAANQIQYGWVGMSAATITPGSAGDMSVTFTGWGYDDTGAVINAGAGISTVPEVSTGVVSALVAALVVGGAELRRWRKSKPANVSQPG